jgi:Arc/MetJ-type ribon-helix-helix transcriptional regulator
MYCAHMAAMYGNHMKTLTVRLPEALVAQIEAESRRRKLSKSDVVRERLARAERLCRRQPALLDAISDIVGSVDGLPRDLNARTKKYLKSSGK